MATKTGFALRVRYRTLAASAAWSPQCSFNNKFAAILAASLQHGFEVSSANSPKQNLLQEMLASAELPVSKKKKKKMLSILSGR